MKKIYACLLLLWCGVLLGEQTLSIDFAEPVAPVIAGKKLELPPKQADGYFTMGERGLEIPAASLVGEAGTILLRVCQDKPAEEITVNRHPFTLRCDSRLTICLYMTRDNMEHYMFAFGDLDAQIYVRAPGKNEYGKDYWMGVTWDGRTVQFYNDGVLFASEKQPIKVTRVRSLYLGQYKDGWRSADPCGKDTHVSKLLVYNEALSASQVAEVCGVNLQPTIEKYPAQLSVPIVDDVAVKADGDLTEEFWSKAASLPVLSAGDFPSKTYQAPAGRFLLSSDSKNLYLGLDYAIPAGNPVTAGIPRTPAVEPEVWGTESFELYLQIGKDVYRFGGNVAGGYTEWKNNGSEWHAPWSYGSQLRMQIDNSSIWQAEAVIPWSTLGLSGPPEEPIRFNFCRTWCLPEFSAATSILYSGQYTKPELFMPLVFGKKFPSMRLVQQNNPTGGLVQQTVSITSPVASKLSYEIALADASGAAMPLPVVSKTRQFKAGETAELELEGRIVTSAYNQLMCTLKDGNTVLARCIAPYALKEVFLDVHKRFLNGYLDVEVPLTLLTYKYGADCAPRLLLIAPDGTEKYRHQLTQDNHQVPFDTKGAAGAYIVRLEDKDGKNLSQMEINFPGLGKWHNADSEFPKDVILPMFQPLSINGKDFNTWGRTYQYGKSLFPEQIINQKQNLFAAAPELLVNGKAVPCTSFKIGKTWNYRGEFTANAEGEGCTVQENGWVEYDGLSYSNFTLKANTALKDIRLRFHLNKEIMKYLHAALGGSWGSKITSPIEEGKRYLAFYPMVWLGMEELGICLFTETAKNWTYDTGKAICIVKQGNKAYIDFFLQKELKAGSTFDFEFGYVASPVKPLFTNHPLLTDGDTHCVPMYRPEYKVNIGQSVIISTPYPHEIDDFFAEIPSEEESETTPHLIRLIAACRKYNKMPIVYMDARHLTDEYPEVAAFVDEWRFLPQRNLDYIRNGRKCILYDCCPRTGANAFFHQRLRRLVERFKPDGIYYDFGLIGICSNKFHGCDERWPILAYREFLRRTILVQYQAGNPMPIVALHNTDCVQVPAFTFASLLINGEHIRQHSSTIMHNGKDIQDTYNIEMFACELSSLPFGAINSVYQANDILLPQFGGGKEDPELYKFRITQAFLAGVLPHNTMLGQARCHFGIIEKVFRIYENFGVPSADFVGYWRKPAAVSGAKDIYVSIYRKKDGKGALAVISHIGKAHDTQTFDVTFDAKILGFTPTKATDMLTRDDPAYQELFQIRTQRRVPNDRAPLKLGDFGSKLNSVSSGKINMTLKFHTFALVELE